MSINDEEVIELLGRLLERLQQADGSKPQGCSNTLIYVAPGAQYVRTIHNQYPQQLPTAPRKRGNDVAGATADPPFDADTPLSALFRENHHEELRKIINSWRPYLIGDDPTIDALAIKDFQFDFGLFRPVSVYTDMALLINKGALNPPMSVLAAYMFQHTNLSRSENALYVQLKRYRKMCK